MKQDREFELVKANQLLEQIQELSKMGYWEVDLAAQKVSWSEETRAIHEVSTDYVPSLTGGINFYDDLSRPIIAKIISNAIEKREKWDVKLGIVTAKGNHKWVRSSGKVHAEYGVVTRLFGVFQDITDEKIALDELLQRENSIAEMNSNLEEQIKARNEELKKTKHKYQKLYDYAPEMMISVDLETSLIIECNLTTCIKLGYSKEELIGSEISLIYHNDFLKITRKAYDELKSSGNLIGERLLVRSKDNTVIDVFLSAIAVKDENGKVIRSNSILKDITSLVDVETKLKAINQDLENIVDTRTSELIKANEELEEFTYIATHDLKSPLASIKGHLEIIRNEIGSSNKIADRSIHWIEDSIENAESKIQNIIDIAKIKNTKGEGNSRFDLTDLVGKVKGDLTTEQKSQVEHFSIFTENNIQVVCNKYYLETIINNLVSNAIKYRKFGQKVTIDILIKKVTKGIELRITDNGLGINMAKDKLKLFKMFHRIHDHVEGNGIGLYLSSKMIENLGGKMEVESELGVGTTFIITL
ncbi:MAG: PAS domain S-box-containing protein [Vicingaceae bacterium]|jgi:PAS domain S-box-containing protein